MKRRKNSENLIIIQNYNDIYISITLVYLLKLLVIKKFIQTRGNHALPRGQQIEIALCNATGWASQGQQLYQAL